MAAATGREDATTTAGADAFDALENALLELAPSMPRLVAYARLEVQLWTMALFGWFWRRRPEDGRDVFTHHRAANWFAIVAVLAFLVVVEAVAMHLVLHAYQLTTAKWVLTALSGYALIWLLGDLQALRVFRSAIRVEHGCRILHLRVGARGHARIALTNIAQVQTGEWEQPAAGEASLVLFGKPNVRLTFHQPNAYKPMLEAEKRVTALSTQVDDPESFVRALS